jgi:glycosyltransferase involved in cell wall biosynthesis
MTTVAAIPVKNNLFWTAPLVEHILLHDEVDEVWIYDNGSTDSTKEWVMHRSRIESRLKIFNASSMGLYQMWNHMIKSANELFESCNLAILNNDIRIPPFAIRDLSTKMREGDFVIAAVDPTRTGLYSYSIEYWDSSRALPRPIEPYCQELGPGDRVGWAFVVAAEFWKGQPYAIDERYRIWYGDDDLYRRAMSRGGRACIVRGIGSDHAESQTEYPANKVADIEHDKALYERIWNNMAHQEQMNFIASVKEKFPDRFVNKKVLEIGSLNINGSIRPFFDNCEYLGVDLEEGADVDLVAEGQDLSFLDSSFDVSISTECFEHNPHWAETFINMCKYASGLVVFTCATTGRREHGTTRTDTYSSPFTAKKWDYYRNLAEKDFREVFDIDSMFESYQFSVNKETHDLYFWGIPSPDKSKIKKKKLKIAVYTIALNEEDFVERWYESAKDADYLLIADTGSTDKTVELARSLGINVFEISVKPWRFDIARNASLSLLPPDIDFCISLDMDEILLPGWREELEKIQGHGITRPRYKYIWNWNEDGSPGLQYNGDKIHSRQGYRWKHPVHEVAGAYGDVVEVQTMVGLEINHHADNTKSRGQYLPLLQMAVQEDPDDDRNAFYYARELFYYGRNEEAIKEFKRHLSLPRAVWPPERAASMRYLGKIDKDNSEDWFKKAIAQAPGRREPHVDLAQFYYEQQDWVNCLDQAMKALSITERPLEYLCEAPAWSWKPHDLAAISLYRLNRFSEALEQGKLALDSAPLDQRLKKNLEFYSEACEEKV